MAPRVLFPDISGEAGSNRAGAGQFAGDIQCGDHNEQGPDIVFFCFPTINLGGILTLFESIANSLKLKGFT